MVRICDTHTSEKELVYIVPEFPQDIFHNRTGKKVGDYWVEWQHGELENND